MSTHPHTTVHLRLGLTDGLFLQLSRLMVHAVILPKRATSPVHLNVTDLITTVILRGEYKSLIASLRSFLQRPVTSSLVCPYVFLGTIFSKTRHSHVLLLTKTNHVSNPEKATSKYSPPPLSLSLSLSRL